MRITDGLPEYKAYGIKKQYSLKEEKKLVGEYDVFKSADIGGDYVYTKQLRQREGQVVRPIYVNEEQFEQLLGGEYGEVHQDGDWYWVVMDEIRYEFKKPEKDEKEEKKTTGDILIQMVDECIERNQEDLDEKFHKWAMKEDILYKNQGKNSVRTLEDILRYKKDEADKADKIDER